MKRISELESSVRRIQEIEVSASGNGIGESGVPEPATYEWAWLLWRKRRALWRVTWRGLIVSVVIAFLLPKQYESTTRLMPPDPASSSGLGMMAAMAGQASGGSGSMGSSALGGVASEMLGLKDQGALWSDMLRSRTVRDVIVDRFDLRKVYRVRYWEDARKNLAKNTKIDVDRKSGSITLTVEDRDPRRAAQIAQAYVEALDHIVADVSSSSARRERIFIEQRLKTVKQDLAKASQEFSDYSSKNATIDLKDQGAAMVEAAAVLQGQLIAAQSELEGLQQIYTASNIRVRSLQARVDELQRQLRKVGGDSRNPDGDDPNAQQEFPSIRKLPLLGVRWADLYRETKIQETVYELLSAQYEVAKIEEAKQIPSVKVFEAAVVPERKSSPHRTVLIALGTFLSLCAGVLWVLGNDTWQRVDPADPRKQLSQEVASRVAELWAQWTGNSSGIARAKAWLKLGKARSDNQSGS